MKVNGMKMHNNFLVVEKDDAIGDQHVAGSFNTPLRIDAFNLDDEEKIMIIAGPFKEIMKTLGLDLTDDSLRSTPIRVAKMYVKEIFGGLNSDNKPNLQLFENKYRYNEMLVEKISLCILFVSIILFPSLVRCTLRTSPREK